MARIVLVADRSLMSEYRNNIFFGFATSAPRGLVPDWFFYRFVCPAVKPTKRGGAVVAPYAVRKIEASLLANGFDRSDVVVAHPEHLENAVSDETRVIGASVMDPLGLGPVTSGLIGLFGGEPYTAHSFGRLMAEISKVKGGERDIRVIMGGPGAWQLATDSWQDRLGVDTLVYGEADAVVPSLFRDAVRGQKTPRIVQGGPVPIEETADIVGPSVSGLIEVSRGCGRGCKFCSPGMSKLRSKPLDRILNEARTNLRSGKNNIILHGEDVFRYGAKGMMPNPQAVERLFESVLKLPGIKTLNISHGAFSSILAVPSLLPKLSEILGLTDKFWKAYEVGLETGSPRLVKIHMAGKSKPFKPDDWPEVVKQATALSNDAHWLPVSTLVMGLPGETADDVMKTLELVDDLADQWIMMYPLFFVPLGQSVGEAFFSKDKVLREHLELFFRCWEINLKQYRKTFDEILPYTNYARWERILMRAILSRFVTSALRGIEERRSAMLRGEVIHLGRKVFEFPSPPPSILGSKLAPREAGRAPV